MIYLVLFFCHLLVFGHTALESGLGMEINRGWQCFLCVWSGWCYQGLEVCLLWECWAVRGGKGWRAAPPWDSWGIRTLGSASLAWERAGRARTAERHRIKLEWKNGQIQTRKDARARLLPFPPRPPATKESQFSHRNCASASVMLAHEEKEAAPRLTLSASPFKGI